MIFNVIYLIASLYHLDFNNGCISQPAHKIPENVTIGSHELVWAVSSMLAQNIVSLYSLLAECGTAEIPCHHAVDLFSSFMWNEHIREVPSKSILVVQLAQDPPRLLFPLSQFVMMRMLGCVLIYIHFPSRLWAPWGQGSVCLPHCAISWAWLHEWSRRVIVRGLCWVH